MCKGKDIYDAKADPLYSKPYIDKDEMKIREVIYGEKIAYRYIHGGFQGTNVKFIFCIPQKEAFEHRFYQHLSPFPGPDEEMAALEKSGEEDFIGFALTHGAAYVESNMGSSAVFGSEADSTIFFKSSAAVAEYCRELVQKLYGDHKIYGYVYGGSGGGYKTMSCIENTNAFDGALPYVIGSPMSLPNCLTVYGYANRVLRNCWPEIMDAVEPGGDGDIYKHLSVGEADALREVLNMGFPVRMCFVLGGDDEGALPVLAPVVHQMDPSYFKDFWEKPGYLGYEKNGNARKDRICMRTKIASVHWSEKQEEKNRIDGRNGTDDAWQKMLSHMDNVYIEAEEVPVGTDLYLTGTDIVFETGKSRGKKLRLKEIKGKCLIPGQTFGVEDYEEILKGLEAGDQIYLDNSDYIAIQSYHRHQVPEDRSFYAWDQFRKMDGTPSLPQRDTMIAFGFTAGGCGSVQDGQIQGNVMVMNNLMDADFPWQADWYRKKVEQVSGEKAAGRFRLYYNDNCPHGDVNEGGDPRYVVSYLGMLRQGLLDLAEWTEGRNLPADTTGYRLENNQVILSEDMEERGGLQPGIKLLANHTLCAEVKAGEGVKFTTIIEIPERAGDFVSVEFDYEGTGDYVRDSYEMKNEERDGKIKKLTIVSEHSFSEPGTYFGVARVVTNRNPKDGYTRLRNLARVRIIVS